MWAREVPRLAGIAAGSWGKLGFDRKPVAVDFYDVAKHVAGGLNRQSLAQFVRQDERRLVLHLEIAGQLERRYSLQRVHEQADCGQIVPDRSSPAIPPSTTATG